MKKYIVMFGLTLVMGLFLVNNAVAQSDWGDNPTTTPFAIGIGDLANPVGANMLQVYRNNVSNIRISRNLTTPSGPIGRLQIVNEADNAFLNIVLRRGVGPWEGQTEMIQSAFSPVQDRWLEYLYVNLDDGKYEIRDGIGHAEWLNEGDVLFNNTGGIGVNVDEIPEGFKLAVNGKVIAEELQIQLKGEWPDFVFADDYELMSLYEVENYIKQNRHLPNVPSEAQVLESGVNVGEMTSILLQKVEELTLHIIELNKRIEELEK